jgi:hypothetical protein
VCGCVTGRLRRSVAAGTATCVPLGPLGLPADELLVALAAVAFPALTTHLRSAPT